MLHPSYNELINAVNSDVEPGEQPVVQSRYSIVIAAAKRARQLIDGEEALVPDYGKKALSVAIEELHKGRVKVVAEELPEEERAFTLPSAEGLLPEAEEEESEDEGFDGEKEDENQDDDLLEDGEAEDGGEDQ